MDVLAGAHCSQAEVLLPRQTPFADAGLAVQFVISVPLRKEFDLFVSQSVFICRGLSKTSSRDSYSVRL